MSNPFNDLSDQLRRIEVILQGMKQQLDRGPPPEEPKFLHSIRELAEFLNCSVTTAQKLKNSGTIPFTQFGRKMIFNAQGVLDALKKKKR